MRTAVCVLHAAEFEEIQTYGFRKNYKILVRKSENVAIGICKEDCGVNVIRTATE
jgi:hypothetical protein